jgi:methionine salvage enolase-phosphatase E1
MLTKESSGRYDMAEEEKQEGKKEGYEDSQKKVVMFDVDGTITEEGSSNPKTRGIEELVKALEKGEIHAEGENWETLKEKILANERYYKRFAVSEEEAKNSSAHTQLNICYEWIKDKMPSYSKLLKHVIISGIRTGRFPVDAAQDAVRTILKLIEMGYGIATYSGGGADLQREMLEKIIVGDSNLSCLIANSAGLHDKSEFGDKLKPDSYRKARDHFAEHGLYLAGFVTDSVGEAKACASAGIRSIYVERGTVIQPQTGIIVVKSVDEILPMYAMVR